jgi:signal transduction histidine kinase
VGRLAYAVENAIIFAETARYLQQLALLNEMASAASLGVDTHEVARRVMERLRRTFRTERASVFLLSADRKILLEYGSELAGSQPRAIPVEKSLVGGVVKTGLPLRTCVSSDSLQAEGRLGILNPAGSVHPGAALGSCSALAVPLKYHGVVIGALALESEESNAFNLQDEQLLVGIASHMAGMFENMRLNEETRERAQKLQDSVRQLQAVRETALEIGSAQGNLDLDTLLQRVVHRARELVDARGAELGLVDEDQGIVKVLVSEKPWQQDQPAQIPLMADVAGRVAALGEPLVVHDYNTWGGRISPYCEEPFKTVAGVPLKFQGQVIGALTVSDDRPGKVFGPEDIQMLELLAPLITVWIRNARLYRELQERIEAQQVAENRLIRSARLAAVGEMAAGVAHELNNPLTTVAGFVELVLEELPQDSPHRPDLELVLREAQRARGVVRRLLDFSRPAENQRVRTDLNELVGDILTLVHHLVRTGGVEMHIELWEDLPWIAVDPAQIKQVLLNLVHNAIQAMPRGGTLAVKTAPVRRQDRDWLCISVADTGVGITAENLERIFEPFFTTRPAGQGTGLGLSVSYGIITEHGGYIEVESHPDQGSCFYIFLPVDGPAGEQVEA